MIKKRYIAILSLVILILSMSFVCAGLFDGLFGETSSQNDLLFEDTGKSNNFSSDWYDVSITLKRDSAGTTISNNYSDDNTAFHFANKPNTDSKSFDAVMDWETPFTVEFDVVNTNDGSNFIQLYDGSNEVRKAFSQLKIVNGSHVKINSDSTITFTVDDNEPIEVNTKLSSASRIGFCLVKEGSLKYKNFIIY